MIRELIADILGCLSIFATAYGLMFLAHGFGY